MSTGTRLSWRESWSRRTSGQQGQSISEKSTAAFTNLVPSEDDIRQVLDQVMATNPMKLPAAMLQIFLARIMISQIEKLRDELYDTLTELEYKISH